MLMVSLAGPETPSTVVVLTPRKKPLITISRSMSLSKLFTSIKRASSLPVTPIAHSNPESAHGRNIAAPATPSSNRKGVQRQIARSLSVSLNGKERGIRRQDSFFRVIPSTPRVKEGDENEISNGSQVADAEASKGTGPDTSYGFSQCYGDLSLVDCVLCYAEARTILPQCYPDTGGKIFLADVS